jgi:hypothetical protein
MHQYWTRTPRSWLVSLSLIVTGTLGLQQSVSAQAFPTPAEQPSPETAPPVSDTPQALEQTSTPTSPLTAPVNPASPVAPAAPTVIPEGEAPTAAVAPAFPPTIPSIDYGARMRIATKFQDTKDPTSFGGVSQQGDADIYMGGQIHRMLKWQASVTLTYAGAPGSNTVSVLPLDLLARFEPMPEFNIYAGRMIVVADRFTPSGPWGMDEFFYPGLFPGLPPSLQKSGATGRDPGVNIWGAPLGGMLKYYLGAYQLHDTSVNPLLSGRLQLSLLSPEPAFYQRTTYFGTKDLIAIGVGGQYQKDGSVEMVAAVPPATMATVGRKDDFTFLTADLVVEKVLGDAGTLSFVGSFMKWSGDFNRWDNFWLASLGYQLPGVIGIGKLRATVRYQQGLDTVTNADASSIIDAQLSYNVMAWFARFQLGYRHFETYRAAANVTEPGNQIYIGVTLADP